MAPAANSRSPASAAAAEARSLASTHEVQSSRRCLIAAFALSIVWFFVFNHFRPDYLVDESGHLGNIYHFLEGKPGWPEQMTMLPGYHFLVVAGWQLHPPLTLLTLARLVTTVTALLALAAFAFAWSRLHARPAGRATLLLALLPILQPFTGLAYTDLPALSFVLVALVAQVSGRTIIAALASIGAVAIRQTSLDAVGFLVAWEFFRSDAPRSEFLRRIRWLLLVLALAVVGAVLTGRLTPGTQTGNTLKANAAALHFAGLLAALLGLPVWIALAPAAARAWFRAFRIRLLPTLAGTILALALAAALALTFKNPHPWNRDLFWPGEKFTLLRNWPLVYLDRHPWLRAASGLNLVLMLAALTWTFAGQRHRRTLWLALACFVVFPLANSLVEPRYLIPPVVMILLFLEIPLHYWRRLAIWWAILSAAHAPFIALGVSLW